MRAFQQRSPRPPHPDHVSVEVFASCRAMSPNAGLTKQQVSKLSQQSMCMAAMQLCEGRNVTANAFYVRGEPCNSPSPFVAKLVPWHDGGVMKSTSE